MPRRPSGGSISGPRVKAAAVVRFTDAQIVATAENEVWVGELCHQHAIKSARALPMTHDL
jgi:hypothetical protein